MVRARMGGYLWVYLMPNHGKKRVSGGNRVW